MYSLAVSIFSNLVDAPQPDVDAFKNMLRAYDVVDESLAPLRLHAPLCVNDDKVTFGVNTSGIKGVDFYLTCLNDNDNTVLYSDGMDENDVPLVPTWSES
jgi:hypothetical protein